MIALRVAMVEMSWSLVTELTTSMEAQAAMSSAMERILAWPISTLMEAKIHFAACAVLRL